MTLPLIRLLNALASCSEINRSLTQAICMLPYVSLRP